MLAMLVMAVLVELSMVQRLGLLQGSELHILKEKPGEGHRLVQAEVPLMWPMPIRHFCIFLWMIFGDGSKPWYLVNIKIAGKWMFIPLKMYL